MRDGRPGSGRVNPRRLGVAYDLLEEAVSGGELPQALLAVADEDGIIRCEARDARGPIDTDELYAIASVTEPIVATAAMRLVEQGRLLVEDSVSRYLPEFAANGKEGVTLWHLLTHTSGLSEEYRSREGWVPTASAELTEACATGLRFPSGTRVEYCNAAFTVLGEVIRRASGIPYQEYLRREVFAPAGMKETLFQPFPEMASRVVPVADFPAAGGLPTFADLASPAGGMFSTADDLVAFGQSYVRGAILGPAAVAVMTALHTGGISSHSDGGTRLEYYGLAWEKPDPREARLLSPSGYGHGGMTGCYLWIEPGPGLVVVFLTNRVGWDRRTRKAIVNAVLAAVE